jgi:hypothetical protein
MTPTTWWSKRRKRLSNLFQATAEFIAANALAHGSVDVIFVKGANAIPMKATLGYQILKTTDGLGQTKIERTDRDFIILASYFELDGEPFRPVSDNTILLPTSWPGYENGKYRVSAPKGEAVWRFSDPFENMIRIHTKFTGKV